MIQSSLFKELVVAESEKLAGHGSKPSGHRALEKPRVSGQISGSGSSKAATLEYLALSKFLSRSII
jgi:hypothetical protein